MKSFNIDVENIEGLLMAGGFIEIQGAMHVRPESAPLEGVHQSSLHMSMATALALYTQLHGALTEAKKRGVI